jgi:hypothetical protein
VQAPGNLSPDDVVGELEALGDGALLDGGLRVGRSLGVIS